MKALTVAFAGLTAFLLCGTLSYAWNNFETHGNLATYAMKREKGTIDQFLGGQLRVQTNSFALRGGEHHATDGLVDRLRLTNDLSLFSIPPFKAAPKGAGVTVADGSETYTFEHLVRTGVFVEDNPNARARHHFLNPLAPPGEKGLDNDADWLPIVDVLLAEVGSALRGGNPLRALAGIFGSFVVPDDRVAEFASFGLQGVSSLDRALNRPVGTSLASEVYPENFFALPDAERYLYRALTAEDADEREHFTAQYILTLGHVLHFLQDAGVPAHARNDFVFEHLVGKAATLERGAKQAGANKAFQVLGNTSTDLSRSLPYEFLQRFNAANGQLAVNLQNYSPVLVLPNTESFDVSGFWGDRPTTDRPSGGGDRTLWGLAERSNAEFFSFATISNEPSGLGQFPEPLLPSATPSRCGGTPGVDPVFRVDLPMRDINTGNAVNLPELVPYVSSGTVPHLARCRLFHEALNRTGLGEDGLTTADEAVNRDYAEILFSMVVDYSQKFLRRILEQRIEVVRESPTSFRLANLTGFPFLASRDSVEIVYPATDGTRQRVPVDCGQQVNLPPSPAPGTPGPLGPVCTFGSFAGLAEPRSRTDLWVVARGAHGERGSIVTPDPIPDQTGSWMEQDYVVAFEHVGGQLFFDRTVQLGSGAPSDATEQVDVYSIPISLTELAPGETVEAVNRTSSIRQALGDPLADFAFPGANPIDSNQIVVRHDLNVAPGEGQPLLSVGSLLDLGILDVSGTVPSIAPIAETRLEIPGGREVLFPVFAPDEETYVALDGEAPDGALTRFSLDGGTPRPIRFDPTFGMVQASGSMVTVDSCDESRGVGFKSIRLIDQASAIAEVFCDRNVGQINDPSTTFVRRGVALFLVSLVDDGADLLAVPQRVISVETGGWVDCVSGVQNPSQPSGTLDNQCDVPLSDSAHFHPVVRFDDLGNVEVAFLYTIPPGDFDATFDQGTFDLFVASAADSSVAQVAAGVSEQPRLMAWEPSGAAVAVYDIDGTVRVCLRQQGVPPFVVARGLDVNNTITWQAPELQLPIF